MGHHARRIAWWTLERGTNTVSGKDMLDEMNIQELLKVATAQIFDEWIKNVARIRATYEIPPGVYRIPVTDLRTDMVVYKEMPNGKLLPDCILEEYFPTSDKRPSISFRTRAGQLVIWHPCGKVWAGYGKGM